MFNLQKRINGIDENRDYLGSRISVRDSLLAREMSELEETMKNLPHCILTYPNQSVHHEMELSIAPTSGLYKGGIFKFTINVPPEYNNVPPVVKCLTRCWHPNINEEGSICLSILRQNSLDGYGWMPTRRMKEVIHGLDSLFTDLMDFEDPLNADAAKQHADNKEAFAQQVRDYINKYCPKR